MGLNHLARLGLFGSLCLFLCACSTGYFANFGEFKTSQEVTDAFESYRVLPDYQYYYIGPDARPDAIIGIKKGYTLDSGIWKPVALTPEHLKLWINQMNYKSFPVMMYGDYMLDSAGNKIGLWYSLWETTTIQVKDNKEVVVYIPQGGPMERRFHAIDLEDY